MTEQSAPQRIYKDYLKDIPDNLRPFVASLVVSRKAAHQEKPFVQEVEETWKINGQLIEKEIKDNFHDKKGVLDRAVWLTTLPTHQDEQTEWYFRWLRGNGLSILADPRMRASLNTLVNEEGKSKQLVEALSSFLDTDVKGLNKKSVSDVPEAFSLLASFLVVDSLGYGPKTENRGKLIRKAEERLVHDAEANRVMDIFEEFPESKSVFERFDAYRQQVKDPATRKTNDS